VTNFAWTALAAAPPALGVLSAAALYLAGVARLARRGIAWPWARTAAFLAGLLTVAVALLPPLATADENFPVHVTQHLLLGMAAPLLLVLSAPMTLVLRVLPPARRRRVARLLHARVVRGLAHPLVGAILAVGALYALYLTPLYAATLRRPALHAAVHAHFLVAGCLFCWSLVGLDPMPRRPGVGVRGAVLVLAMGAHATLAKLLYAHGPAVAGLPAADPGAWRLGAQLMWYGGDALDLVLCVVFYYQWYAAGGRRLARQATAGHGGAGRGRRPSTTAGPCHQARQPDCRAPIATADQPGGGSSGKAAVSTCSGGE
jgi:putative membrane protein